MGYAEADCKSNLPLILAANLGAWQRIHELLIYEADVSGGVQKPWRVATHPEALTQA